MTVAGWYRVEMSQWRNMAAIWNGDKHEYPWQSNFVLLSTEMLVIHLLLESRHWYDIAYILLDEIHNPRALTLLILEYILHLRAIGDKRCARVQVLLVSETLMSPRQSEIDLVKQAYVKVSTLFRIQTAARSAFCGMEM